MIKSSDTRFDNNSDIYAELKSLRLQVEQQKQGGL